MIAMDCNGFILHVWSGLNLMWSNGWEFVFVYPCVWSVLIGNHLLNLLGGCHLLYTVGLNVVMGWVSFIEHNGFKCWITQQLWLTYISFYYVQVLIFTSHTQHQSWSDGLKSLAFCTYWLDHFGRRNGFMSFLV